MPAKAKAEKQAAAPAVQKAGQKAGYYSLLKKKKEQEKKKVKKAPKADFWRSKMVMAKGKKV